MISWKSKRQVTMSRLSVEAEYRAIATTVSEIVWVYQLLQDFQTSVTSPAIIFCDNQAAIQIVSNLSL